jgi:DNA-binding transcriptional MerR regulator
MSGYLIAEVAQRTGFSTSALRFYEQSGLVRPGRTPAGYRRYDDEHLDTLAFIGRAKGFGLTLDEITELVGLLGQDQCAPVQDRLRALVDTKIAEAERRIAELSSFTDELRRVAATLERHTPLGPCDDTCGCTTDTTAAAPVTFTPGAARAMSDVTVS